MAPNEHHAAGGQCKPGAPITWEAFDASSDEQRGGSSSVQVPVGATLSADGSYSIAFAIPLPARTDTPTITRQTYLRHRRKGIWRSTGSGSDFDKHTTTTSQIAGGSDLISLGVTDNVDPDAPDTLQGDQVQPGSTDEDRWETIWQLDRN